MMNINKWLVVSVVFLSLGVFFNGAGNYFQPSGEVTNNAVQMETNPDILTFKEAAVYLRIDEQDLLKLIESSQYSDGQGIPYYKIDGTIMFSKTALTEWTIKIAVNRMEY